MFLSPPKILKIQNVNHYLACQKKYYIPDADYSANKKKYKVELKASLDSRRSAHGQNQHT